MPALTKSLLLSFIVAFASRFRLCSGCLQKDSLANHLARCETRCGIDVAPRFPRTFLLRRKADYKALLAEMDTGVDDSEARLFVLKPCRSSKGQGVRVVSSKEQLECHRGGFLVQRYIANPLTVQGAPPLLASCASAHVPFGFACFLETSWTPQVSNATCASMWLF